MLKEFIAIVLFITGVGPLLGQYHNTQYLVYNNLAAVDRTGIYTEADSIYLDYRVDSLGAQFLVLSNFTDSTILYAGDPAGLLDYSITALNPNGEWTPLNLSGGIYCGTGYVDYRLPAMHHNWVELRQDYVGSYSTHAKFTVMVQGQEYATRPIEMGLKPDLFLPFRFNLISIEQNDMYRQNEHPQVNMRVGKGRMPIQYGFRPFTLEELMFIYHALDPNDSDFYIHARRLLDVIIISIQHKPSLSQDDRQKYSAAFFAFTRYMHTRLNHDLNSVSEFYQAAQNTYATNSDYKALVDEVDRDPLQFLLETMIPMYQKYVLEED